MHEDYSLTMHDRWRCIFTFIVSKRGLHNILVLINVMSDLIIRHQLGHENDHYLNGLSKLVLSSLDILRSSYKFECIIWFCFIVLVTINECQALTIRAIFAPVAPFKCKTNDFLILIICTFHSLFWSYLSCVASCECWHHFVICDTC